ncbi:MAG: hypothetical protein ACETWB_02660 [Anaerolineae bacterium]
MIKKRIQVYADEETKRRIELAAAKHQVAVTQYCLEAIKQQLAEDDMLEQERIEIPIKPTKEEDLIAALRELREKIKARRGGRLITLDIVEQVREEREYELLGVR